MNFPNTQEEEDYRKVTIMAYSFGAFVMSALSMALLYMQVYF